MQRVRAAPPTGRTSMGGSAGGFTSTAFSNDDLGLSFYSQPPNAEVSAREFEELTCNRLKVLHALDRALGYEIPLNQVSEQRPKVQPELNNAHLTLAYPVPGKVNEFKDLKDQFLRRDYISHFALRLAFCKSRDAREWFVRQEQRLFVLRLDQLTAEAQEAFLVTAGLNCRRFEQGSGEGAITLKELQIQTPGAKLWADSGAGGRRGFEYDSVFYEMPFFDVHPSLIARRQVVVQHGQAYVPSSAMKLILAARFKERLNSGLDVAFTGLQVALADPRIGSFLRLIQDHGMQLLVAPKSSADDPGEKLSLENFEEMLERSMPPCMRRAVEAQREKKKHLKHAGRLQLRPFLKDCGFTFEESLRWWRQEMTKDPEVDTTSFEKNYTYDVEHAYGKKGHFQGQNSFGCPKIIGFPHEAAGQVHGCLFKLDLPAIKQQLHKWRVPESSMGEIEKLLNNGKHYQLACVEYFKCRHPGHTGDGVGNSPNDFFRESCRHHLQKKEKESGTSPNKPQSK